MLTLSPFFKLSGRCLWFTLVTIIYNAKWSWNSRSTSILRNFVLRGGSSDKPNPNLSLPILYTRASKPQRTRMHPASKYRAYVPLQPNGGNARLSERNLERSKTGRGNGRCSIVGQTRRQVCCGTRIHTAWATSWHVWLSGRGGSAKWRSISPCDRGVQPIAGILALRRRDRLPNIEPTSSRGTSGN